MKDYTGLELLSEVAAISPETLLIFAASPERLGRLSYRLQVFGLLDTLAYPITPRKILAAPRGSSSVLSPCRRFEDSGGPVSRRESGPGSPAYRGAAYQAPRSAGFLFRPGTS